MTDKRIRWTAVLVIVAFAAILAFFIYSLIVSADSYPEPIPLERSKVATPIAWPHTPPIRATPMFVSIPVDAGCLPCTYQNRIMRALRIVGGQPDSERVP